MFELGVPFVPRDLIWTKNSLAKDQTFSDAKFFGPKMNFNERQLLDGETGLLNRNFFRPTMVFINNFVGSKILFNQNGRRKDSF